MTTLNYPGEEEDVDIADCPIVREYINEKGQVIKMERFNQMMQLSTSCVLDYDKDEKLVKKAWFDRFGKPLTTEEY